TIRIWDLKTRKTLRILTGHRRGVSEIAFSPDGSLLASESEDHTVRLWKVASGQLVRKLSGLRSVVSGMVFTAGGKHLEVVGEKESLAWKVADGTRVAAPPAQQAPPPSLQRSIRGRDGVTIGISGNRLLLWRIVADEDDSALSARWHRLQVREASRRGDP